MPKNGKSGKGGTDDSEMAALEAITNALLQEVKSGHNPNVPNGHISSDSEEDEKRRAEEDDNEPKLLRIIIYETSV